MTKSRNRIAIVRSEGRGGRAKAIEVSARERSEADQAGAASGSYVIDHYRSSWVGWIMKIALHCRPEMRVSRRISQGRAGGWEVAECRTARREPRGAVRRKHIPAGRCYRRRVNIRILSRQTGHSALSVSLALLTERKFDEAAQDERARGKERPGSNR